MAKGKRTITEEEILAALELYQSVGLNQAEKRSTLSKKTILKYARERGVVSNTDPAVAAQMQKRSLAAAVARSKKVNEKIDSGVDRAIQVIEIAMARELQVLSALSNPTVEDLRAITSARTTAVKDLEMLLRRAGQMVNSADGGELIETIKNCLRGALLDAELPEETLMTVQLAFAHRLRLAQAGEELPADQPAELTAGDEED